MNGPKFRPAMKACLFFITITLASNAAAQLHYIPSEWLREWMNGLAPGCVNAEGYLDPDHPGLDTVHTAVCLVNTLDLTGLQYLHHLKELTILCAGAGVNTPVLPDSLERLYLSSFGFTGPLALPDGLISLRTWESWSGSIGAIPASLDTLVLRISDTSLGILLGPLPDGMRYMELSTSGQITGITSLPSSLRHLNIFTEIPICLPVLPPTMDHLELSALAVHCLPNLPLVQDPDNLILPSSLQLCDPVDQCIYANAIGGSLWHDADGDGLRGPDERPMPGDAILISSAGIAGVASDGSWMCAASEGSYSVSALPMSPYATAPTPVSQSVTLNTLDPVVILPGVYYQLIPDITDVAMDLTATPLIAGQITQVRMTLHNIGTETASGSATVEIPEGLDLLEITPDPMAVSGQTVTWSVDQLEVGEQRTWTLSVWIPALMPGTMLTFNGNVATSPPDSDPANNSSQWSDHVLAAYDPNDKLVHPATVLAEDMTLGVDLHYTIRFQNTGNYPASRVVIVDTLSSDLIPSSMRYVSSSHPCSWWMNDGVLTFRFDPIQLPDSTSDPLGSQGYVKFKIATQPALPAGHQIHNAASIFFDINPPIHTPPVVFEVVDETTGIDRWTAERVRIGPNPASDRLFIQLDATWGPDTRVTISDVLGRRTHHTVGPQVPTEMDLTGLASGPLFITFEDAALRQVAKVIKY